MVERRAGRAPALFITGTDTGVGKTRVACALAAWLRGQGLAVGVVKPVETGWPALDPPLSPTESFPEGSDGAALRLAAGDPDPLDRIVPFRLAEPLAPLLAAERAGRVIDLAAIAELVEEKRRRFDAVLLEGAGGLRVPITATATTLDLITTLGVPVLVVAANRLGVINHLSLTLECLRAARVSVLGAVLNRISADPDLARELNPGYLARSLGAAYLGEVPHVAGPCSSERMASDLARWLSMDSVRSWMSATPP